jgi:hypothetical protein
MRGSIRKPLAVRACFRYNPAPMSRRAGVLLSLLVIACSSKQPPAPKPVAPVQAVVKPVTPAPAPPPVKTEPGTGTGTGTGTGSPMTATGTDFAAQVIALYRVGACGSDEIDPRFDAHIVKDHCAELRGYMKAYRKDWADRASAFIAALRPADAPKTVVYPFGGGDLTSALTVFPDATEITTISLEAAGDVRTIDAVKKNTLRSELDEIAHNVQRLFRSAHSTTKSLQKVSHATIPGTIVFALAGLAVHDMEPLSLRYFDIDEHGDVKYLTAEELDARAVDMAKSIEEHEKHPKRDWHYWYEQESAFANIEITYRPRGDASATPRVYRHIVANLDDDHTNKDGRVIKHLEKKGKVSVMTKAASFLLWYDDFQNIRNYLLGHIAWMISDASGIPPSYAGPAGYEQTTYGDFTGPYFIKDPKNTRAEFVKLWKSQPHRALPFRFGYPDAAKNAHLMITRPKTS